ncbi:zinc knuckle CX2CX4HX4C [Artemisia annua]|uniref:Zinc knuckle CX2CX4HX4C n=1 Tax=Artemisia annua TaxID=35608 RepID=A0A2U1LUG7_ARTAN|nr:zinc knuckle CX2CX4HX4C [Artemisia annua]
MDKVTTSMCEKGYGRASFARVLVEVDSTKGIVDSVELWYRNLNRSMQLRVEYAWQPPICSHCSVFGHSFNGCTKRTLSDVEKTERNNNNVQGVPKNNVVSNGNEVWQSVSRNVGEPVQSQPVLNSFNGGGNARYGANMGRGGSSFKGRGGFSGRGGYSGVQMSSEKRYVAGKSNEKEKEIVTGDKQQQGKKKDVVVEGVKESQVKYIAQRDFKTNNRYSVLANESVEDTMNELQGIKVKIDVACEMGIPIDEEESKKWHEELQRYYEEKCVAMQKNEKKALLQNKIKLLEKEIVASNRGIELKSKKEAEEGVANEMECTGNSRSQAFADNMDVDEDN